MEDGFRKRFGLIASDSVEARHKFVERVNAHVFAWFEEKDTFILSEFIPWISLEGGENLTTQFPKDQYGLRFVNVEFRKITRDEFYRTVWLIEKLYQFIKEGRLADLNPRSYLLMGLDPLNLGTFIRRVEDILERSESVLGIFWIEGKFYPAGSKELDEKLLKETLIGFGEERFSTAEKAWGAALEEYRLIENENDQTRKSSVIKLAYEALEATAQVILSNTKDISANRQGLVSKLKISEHYKTMLKSYIEYGNDFRHPSGTRPKLSKQETEAFLYMTGIFIRLAQGGY